MSANANRVVIMVAALLGSTAVVLLVGSLKSPPSPKIEKDEVFSTWNVQQEYVLRQDRSPVPQGTGLYQSLILNWGTQLAFNVSQQVGDKKHPMYQQPVSMGLAKAEVYAASLLEAVDLKGVTAKACNRCDEVNGVIISFINPTTKQEQRLLLPKEAFLAIMLSYSQAAASARNLEQRPLFDLTPQISTLIELKKENLVLYGSAKDLEEMNAMLEKTGLFPDSHYV